MPHLRRLGRWSHKTRTQAEATRKRRTGRVLHTSLPSARQRLPPAYKSAIGTYGYRLGAYAGTPYLKHALHDGIIRFGWRPNAGSWSNDGLPYQPSNPKAMLDVAKTKTPAHIWQTGNYWFNKSADENLLLRVPCGSHWEAVRAAQRPKPQPQPTPTPQPQPTPQPAPLPYYHEDRDGAQAIVSPDGQWAVFISNDGKLSIRQYDPALKRGVVRRNI